MAEEKKQKTVTWNGVKYRINEDEEFLIGIPVPRRSDECTVYRLNAKNEVDARKFWMPEDKDYFVWSGQAGRPIALESFGMVVERLNAVLAAKAAAEAAHA